MSSWWPGVTRAVAAAAVLGVVSAFGDWLWARFIPDGAIVPGVLHGVAIFLVLAVVLGRATGVPGATGRLLATLPVTGLLIAAAFYPLAALVGYLGALVATWTVMWLVLAVLLRWARGVARGEGIGRALGRGTLAAVASGLAFWAISGIWTSPSPEPVNYAVRAASWTFAYLPGFLALLVGRALE